MNRCDPFHTAAAMHWSPLMVAVNRVGEPPKSSSRFNWAAGTVQMSCRVRVEDSRTIEFESPALGLFGSLLPVVTKTCPALLTAGVLQTLAPTEPLGTARYVPAGEPVDWLNALMPPRTSGLSHCDEIPM